MFENNRFYWGLIQPFPCNEIEEEEEINIQPVSGGDYYQGSKKYLFK